MIKHDSPMKKESHPYFQDHNAYKNDSFDYTGITDSMQQTDANQITR